MASERWARLESLFADAVALPAGERDAFLERACHGDDGLRDDVLALIRSHEAAGFMDGGRVAVEPAPPASLGAGTRIGAWRIEGLIGRGGMGEVYLAHRTDAGFDQRAALKLLRYEAASQVRRFHVERRIVARLEHAAIARVLDGGIAEDGRPFMAMEYVEGVPLDAYCARVRPSLARRLDLFEQICDAVAFAHRNLVIHRDLKPANILVGDDGRVKLLDFGIAKLIDDADPDGGSTTLAPLTPAYAAPEQLSGLPVTTATDVHALGVLLFVLLTGERPHRTLGLPALEASRMLLDRDAPPPSGVALRLPDAPVAAAALRGDLDAIVARCLRKDPAARYDSVGALVADLARHRRSEPVAAREGARAYVFGRFLRRNRWAIGGVAAVIAALSAGLVGTLWQARRAETQARTAAAVQVFVGDLFRANARDQADPLKARATTARELLDLGARKIDAGMADAPAAKLGVLKLLGELYEGLALDDEAVRLRTQAVELARTVYGDRAIETADALLVLAGSMHYAGGDPARRGRLLDEAGSILDGLGDAQSPTRGTLWLKLAEHYYGTDPSKALDFARRASRLFEARPVSADLAEALYSRGLLEHANALDHDAIGSLRRAIEVSTAVEGPRNANLPRYYAYLGQYLYRELDIAEAETATRTALDLAVAVNGPEHVDVVQTRMRLGRLLFDTGRTREGLALIREARDMVVKTRGADDPISTASALGELGSAQVRFGEIEAGLPSLQAAVANRRAQQPDSTYLATALEVEAAADIELGRRDAALAALDEASAIRTRGGTAHGARSNFNTGIRIRLALDGGDVETARSLLRELASDPAMVGGVSIAAMEADQFAAEIDLAGGDFAAARARSGRLRAAIDRGDLAAYFVFQAMRIAFIEGSAALGEGQPEQALPMLENSLAARERLLAPTSPKIAEAQVALARCEWALGHRERARSLADAAAAIHAAHAELGAAYRAPLAALLAQIARR